jgi:hypothetical protein
MPAENTIQKLQYRAPAAALEGSLAELPFKLTEHVEYDAISLDGRPASKCVTLWFRSGAKKVFHVRVIRKTGRFLIEMGGLEPRVVLSAVKVCRNHFDDWFKITPEDIRRT